MSDNESCLGLGALLVIAVLLFGCGGCWSWYKAGVQSDVYRREGIDMSTWEVFIGTKPGERTINIK